MSKQTLISAKVFAKLYAQQDGNARQSVAFHSSQIFPFLQWAERQQLNKLTRSEWERLYKEFLRLPV